MIDTILAAIIANFLLALAILFTLAIFLGLLAVVIAIRNGIQATADNVHRIRSRLERDGHRIQDILNATEQIAVDVGDFHRAEKRRRPSEF
jgi:hypothetical protein